MKVTLVAGARPNFMKIAPILKAMDAQKACGVELSYRLVHTGQHYDQNMSQTFFEELGIPKPDTNLDVGSGSQAEQTGAIMIRFEEELNAFPCDLVLVVGDVTSTLACTIVAKKAGIDVAHVEAGIRSGDMSMPEEINRIVTDSLSDLFFTTSTHANENLAHIGVPESKIFFVGNVMIDTLLANLPRLQPPPAMKDLALTEGRYFVMTLHRPSNVDEESQFKGLLTLLCSLAKDFPIVFPVHPRTRKLLNEMNLNFANLHCVEPLGYLHFNYLVKNAYAVLTDSGGITEETTVMGVPCMTLRDSTERPETCLMGTNVLVGKDEEKIKTAFDRLFAGDWNKGRIPELWDGKAAERIVEVLIQRYA